MNTTIFNIVIPFHAYNPFFTILTPFKQKQPSNSLILQTLLLVHHDTKKDKQLHHPPSGSPRKRVIWKCNTQKIKVYRGEQDATKMPVAVKILEKARIDRDEYMKAALFSQIKILQLLKSENVVRVLDVMESSHNYYIIQEICDSDLQKLLANHPHLPQQTALGLLKQICNGFLALVKQGIVHRDLKPANLMMSKGTIKIGDFGFAKKNVSNRMKIVTSVGTPLYMSLQVLKAQPYTSKRDVWATGFIFYQMIHGRTPWTAHSEFELVKNIESKPLLIDPTLSNEAKDFLQRTLALQENNRLSWDQVFVHPLFGGAFNQFAQQNHNFENKMKAVMSELRFQVNSKNIDLSRLLDSLGFQNAQTLVYKQFQRFIRHINPDLTRPEIKFFFSKMEVNADGSISIEQIAAQMENHHISFSKLAPELHGEVKGYRVKKTQSLECSEQKKMSSQLEIRVKKCFIKLYNILNSKGIPLFRTFKAFDLKRSGNLVIDQFERILIKLDTGFTRAEVQEVFDFVDVDSSKTIEFEQLRSFYCKINGIPETLEDPNFYASPSKSHNSINEHSKCHSRNHRDSSSSHRQDNYHPQAMHGTPHSKLQNKHHSPHKN